MKKTTAIFGSILINVLLGVAVAAVFSVSPTSQAIACAVQQQAPVAPPPAAPAQGGGGQRHSHGYLVDVRMGWAAG
ncbi:MAG: hypothetical protein JOZ67_06775 [Gammaproteobacteria bacterium]|nr:hypothetical protein [Gammaproteobacteria bacterium]MBV9697460.1 hypothetical protein [Gammaproteobacteria bacterium]